MGTVNADAKEEARTTARESEKCMMNIEGKWCKRKMCDGVAEGVGLARWGARLLRNELVRLQPGIYTRKPKSDTCLAMQCNEDYEVFEPLATVQVTPDEGSSMENLHAPSARYAWMQHTHPTSDKLILNSRNK